MKNNLTKKIAMALAVAAVLVGCDVAVTTSDAGADGGLPDGSVDASMECEVSQKAAPVCGKDGKTYMNRELAKCADAGIARAGNCDCPATPPTPGAVCPSSLEWMQCSYPGPYICECSPTKAWDCSATWCGYCYDKAADACAVGFDDAACGSGAVQECKDCTAQGMVCDSRGSFCSLPTASSRPRSATQ